MPALPLPALARMPEVVRRGRLSERVAARLDAIAVMVPEQASEALLDRLANRERWRRLRARPEARAGAVLSTSLANARDTRAVLGILPAKASPFETLALAGRMLKETASRHPETLALAAPASGGTHAAALGALITAALAHAFEMPDFRKPAAGRRRIRRIEAMEAAGIDQRYIEACAEGNNLARYLTAMPSNVLDARAYRRFILELARSHRLAVRWLDERSLGRLGAGAFLAVSRGSAARTAGIAHLSYRPGRGRHRPSARGAPDVALIGKGIVFDTGGTNLKPHRSMFDMHIDMSGSAVALATLVALSRLGAPIAADAWVAVTDNAIGPSAYRPQDVVRASNGTTIQVVHTDAEGRMVLADTLALAARTQPRLMIDFATLTGSCIAALTERMSGVFTNEPRLTETLVAAGRSSGERVWNFPCDADYDADLESKVADVLQCAVEGKGDHILAARFLGRFVPQRTPWVHLDLSSALRSGGLGPIPTDVTGFGVRYALELLLKTQVLDHLSPLARASRR
jgi:leucyl aminopeptidase